MMTEVKILCKTFPAKLIISLQQCMHMSECEIQTYQSICVVTHVPEGDKGQSDPAAILSRDLVLTGHH